MNTVYGQTIIKILSIVWTMFIGAEFKLSLAKFGQFWH